MPSRRYEKQLLMLIENIEREEPFTAFGLFSVDTSTLSGVVATTVTYIIVLVQFNFCQSKDSTAISNAGVWNSTMPP